MIRPEFLYLALRDLIGIRGRRFPNREQINATMTWLTRAQFMSGDAGVSAWFGMKSGWSEPYIETTGYIITTFLECSNFLNNKFYKKKAVKMANFLLSQQLRNGGFRTYVGSSLKGGEPTIFNSGQDLIGMVDIYKETGKLFYYESLNRVADFLCNSQSKDGSFEKYSYDGKGHSYDSRVAYSLLKAFNVTRNRKYKDSADANLRWIFKQRKSSGWFKNMELPYPNPPNPYTHTICYTIEGLLYSALILEDGRLFDTAKEIADRLLNYYIKHKFMPGTFDNKWKSKDKYSCITGDAQIATIWLTLYKHTKKDIYRQYAHKINTFIKGCTNMDIRNKNIRGGVPGCYPIYGDIVNNTGYCRMTLINWAAKYFVDSLLLEEIYKTGGETKFLGK